MPPGAQNRDGEGIPTPRPRSSNRRLPHNRRTVVQGSFLRRPLSLPRPPSHGLGPAVPLPRGLEPIGGVGIFRTAAGELRPSPLRLGLGLRVMAFVAQGAQVLRVISATLEHGDYMIDRSGRPDRHPAGLAGVPVPAMDPPAELLGHAATGVAVPLLIRPPRCRHILSPSPPRRVPGPTDEPRTGETGSGFTARSRASVSQDMDRAGQAVEHRPRHGASSGDMFSASAQHLVQ